MRAKKTTRKSKAKEKANKSRKHEWRQFEKLVARIEGLLTPGATIASPDWIPDLVTGEDRQVDASIRYQSGSVPILITIECRKRGKSQDQRWIEEMATKRESIGAAKTICVSASGFFGPAVDLARRKNIETRTMAEIDSALVQRWITGVSLRVFQLGWKIIRIEYLVIAPGLSAEEIEKITGPAGPRGDKEARFDRSGTSLSAFDLARELEEMGGMEGCQVPTDGAVHRRIIDADYPDDSLRIVRGENSVVVKRVRLHFDMIMTLVSGEQTSKSAEYGDGEKALYQISEHSTIFEKGEVAMSFYCDMKDQTVSVHLSVLNEETGELKVISQNRLEDEIATMHRGTLRIDLPDAPPFGSDLIKAAREASSP